MKREFIGEPPGTAPLSEMDKALARPFRTALLAGAAVATSLSFGLSYGIVNQNQYLLQALHWLDPEFFSRDWFTLETTQYHAHFSALVWLLGHIGPLGPMLTGLNALLIALSVVVVHAIAVSVTERDALVVTLLVAALMIAGATTSFAGTYLFTSYLQPSGMAALFLLVAAACFVTDHHGWSGIALAAAGFIHLNFLVLGGILFGLAQVFLGRDRFLSRALRQFWLLAIVMAFAMPTMLAVSSPGATDEARRIYFTFRVPHHYLPSAYWRDMVEFLGWQLLAFPCVGRFAASAEAAPRRLVVLYASGLLVIAACQLATTIVFVPAIALLFSSRLAPGVTLLAQIMVCATCVALVLHRRSGTWAVLHPWRGAVAGLGLLALALGDRISHSPGSREGAGYLLVLGALLAAQAGGVAMSRAAEAPRTTMQVAIIALGVLSLVAYVGVPRFKQSTLLFGMPDRAAEQLYRWAATTPKDALFAIPPWLEDFRLHSRRSIIVDWKSVPGLPVEILEWHRRLADVTGLEQVTSEQVAERGYHRMDAMRAERLAARYGAQYVVLRTKLASAMPWCHEVFRNREFFVCALGSP